MDNQEKPLCKPSHVANYFIFRSKKESDETIKYLPLMKLLKLVYIGYAWCYVINGKKLFDEPIEAWKHGPVVSSLYHEFKYRGGATIDRFSDIVEMDDENNITVIEPAIEDQESLAVLNAVWKLYKHHTAWELSNITHKETGAWSKVYEEDKNNPLKDDDIKKAAEKKIKELYEQGKL